MTTQNLTALTHEEYQAGLQMINRIRVADLARILPNVKPTILSAETAKDLADERRFMLSRPADDLRRTQYLAHIAPIETYIAFLYGKRR